MGKKKAGGGVRVKQMGPKMPPMPLNPMEALAIPPDEQIQLPVTPDRSYQVFWPIHETFTMKTEGFQVVYPSYLDATKTVKQGRRIGLEKAVPTPTVTDLSQGLQMMQIRHVLQPYKGYSRDGTCQWENPGRLLVDVSQFPKKTLLFELAQRIVALPERLQRLQKEKLAMEEEAKKREEEEQIAKKAIAASTGASSTTSSNNKKKGKKGNNKKK